MIEESDVRRFVNAFLFWIFFTGIRKDGAGMLSIRQASSISTFSLDGRVAKSIERRLKAVSRLPSSFVKPRSLLRLTGVLSVSDTLRKNREISFCLFLHGWWSQVTGSFEFVGEEFSCIVCRTPGLKDAMQEVLNTPRHILLYLEAGVR